MEKNNMYKPPIHKKINNNKTVFYAGMEERTSNFVTDSKSVREKLDDLFRGYGHVYNISVTIVMKDKSINTNIISKTNDEILTIDNEKIYINDIVDLRRHD